MVDTRGRSVYDKINEPAPLLPPPHLSLSLPLCRAFEPPFHPIYHSLFLSSPRSSLSCSASDDACTGATFKVTDLGGCALFALLSFSVTGRNEGETSRTGENFSAGPLLFFLSVAERRRSTRDADCRRLEFWERL